MAIELDKVGSNDGSPLFANCGHPKTKTNVYVNKEGTDICKICRNTKSQIAHKKWINGAPERKREHHLKSAHKITLEDYTKMLKKQGGACAICKQPPKAGEFLVVDHDHSCCPTTRNCGKCHRGLLCQMCNHGIGNFKENLDLLKSAGEYIIYWGGKL